MSRLKLGLKQKHISDKLGEAGEHAPSQEAITLRYFVSIPKLL